MGLNIFILIFDYVNIKLQINVQKLIEHIKIQINEHQPESKIQCFIHFSTDWALTIFR